MLFRSRALDHYRSSIAFKESSGNAYGAAITRYNVAALLLDAGRYPEALEYAHAALREFEGRGAGGTREAGTIRGLIGEIERAASA